MVHILLAAWVWLLTVAPALSTAAEDPTPVKPVEKVIKLLEDLKAEVEGEGSAEAATYDEFACFCKSTTESKATAITSGRDNINSLSADIAVKTADKQGKVEELGQRKAEQEALTQELRETTARCEKAKAEYEATSADLNKAISSLTSAISAMEDSKPQAPTLISLRSSLEHSLALADALNLIQKPKHQALSAFLQTSTGVDPADPTYRYHSRGILDILTKLLADFRSEKADVDAEWAKTELNCKNTIDGLNGRLVENGLAMDALSGAIDDLTGEIATARLGLVNAELMLKDDQQYLKDLTERCEVRAKDWDQRSQMRASELAALSGALELMKNNVSGLDTEVNERALLLQRGGSGGGLPAAPRRPLPKAAAKTAVLAGISRHPAGPAFVQEEASRASGGHGLLRGAHAAALSAQARQEKVVTLLSKEGRRLGSTALSALSVRLAEDPFTKVKTLIQELVERLLKEATAEATKKGWCDEELGKANKDREFRLADTKKLDVEIQGLELKEAELTEEIGLLTEAIGRLTDDLNTTTVQREQEHVQNLDAIKKAQEGLAAVQMAIDILKVFYKQAAKATALLQISPVDEDTTGAGFAGAYKGKQASSKGIIGMLQVIESDFDRTVRMTEAAEKKAHEEFVEFDRASRADISGKETKKALDEEDLKATVSTIDQKMDDLQTAQDLLDSALNVLTDLKPTCTDTGMSYEERVQKREDEIAALKNAVCLLDSEGEEPEC